MATAVQQEEGSDVQQCSAWGIARTLDMLVSTVHKILRNILHCYPCKIIHVMELLTADLPARETFALEFFTCIELDNEWPWKILWTDVAHLHLTGYVNSQICHYGQQKIHLQIDQYHFILQGHCVAQVCGIIYHRAIFFRGDGCF